jgi:hypothetical protein
VIVSAKHRFVLWVPTLLFVFLILGNFGRDTGGELIFSISTRGMISSVLILTGATLLSHGERQTFVSGIVFWVLALAALLLGRSTLLVVHF